MPAARAIERWGYPGVRGTREREPCMASKRCGLLKPPLPSPIGGGDSTSWTTGHLLREPAGLAPARRAAKTCWGTNDKAADPAGVAAAFVAEMLRESNPGHVLFLRDRRSI